MSSDEVKVPVIEEVANIEKVPISKEKVTVRTLSETTMEHLEATLSVQSVLVERRLVNKQIDTPPLVRSEGDITIIPIVEERLVAEKRLFLVEELWIIRSENAEAISIPIELRKQRAVIERDVFDKNDDDAGL